MAYTKLNSRDNFHCLHRPTKGPNPEPVEFNPRPYLLFL
jgi:hypothetical protein